MPYSTRKDGARNEAIKWYQQNRGKKMFREVSVQKASVFKVIQICTSIFLGFFLIRKGSSRGPHKRNQNGKMLAPNVMARFIVSLLGSPNQRFLWSLCMRSIYSTPSTDRYKTHYTHLVLLIRNHNKIISRHFFVIHISLSFSDSNITISTIETETLAYLLHEELSLAHYVTLKDIVQIQCFSEFNILNL